MTWTPQDEATHKEARAALIGMVYGASGVVATAGAVLTEGPARWACVALLALAGLLAVSCSIIVTLGWWLKAQGGSDQ